MPNVQFNLFFVNLFNLIFNYFFASYVNASRPIVTIKSFKRLRIAQEDIYGYNIEKCLPHKRLFMNVYHQLEQHFKKYYDFENLSAIVSWDEAAMMPTGGGQARAKALATLSAVQHDWLTNKKVADWIKQAKDLEGLSLWQQKNIYWIEKQYQQATCIPAQLIEQFTNESSICTQAWRELRAKNDWHSFKPYLKKLFASV